MLLLIVLACAPPLDAPEVLENPAHDFDGDDFSEDDGDCDDSLKPVNPDAVERCNGLDDDCDGLVDESNAIDAQTFWYDADGDGFGTTAVPACEQPPTASILAGDCDDARSGAHPGADEYCNGNDDDCDGSTDEEDAADCDVYYEDLDGDFYGSSVERCVCPDDADLFTTITGDCDDLNRDVNPDMDEICGNAVDDDCDGLEVNACFDDDVSAADADLVFLAEEGGDRLGHSALMADLDGDGDVEVVLGATNHEGMEPQSGRTYVVDGPVYGLAESGVVEIEDAHWIWDGVDLNHRLGSSLSLLQDDAGVAQLVVGALGEDTNGELAGAAYLVSWPPAGSGLMPDVADVVLYGNAAGDKAGGWTVAGRVASGTSTAMASTTSSSAPVARPTTSTRKAPPT